MAFKHYSQRDSSDCGAVCLQMIAASFGRYYNLFFYRKLCGVSRSGTNMYNIAKAAKHIGLKPLLVKVTLSYLAENKITPCILFWNKNHFVVLYKTKIKNNARIYYISDPGFGKLVLTEDEMIFRFSEQTESEKGYALILTPTENFYSFKETPEIDTTSSPVGLINYILKY